MLTTEETIRVNALWLKLINIYGEQFPKAVGNDPLTKAEWGITLSKFTDEQILKAIEKIKAGENNYPVNLIRLTKQCQHECDEEARVLLDQKKYAELKKNILAGEKIIKRQVAMLELFEKLTDDEAEYFTRLAKEKLAKKGFVKRFIIKPMYAPTMTRLIKAAFDSGRVFERFDGKFPAELEL